MYTQSLAPARIAYWRNRPSLVLCERHESSGSKLVYLLERAFILLAFGLLLLLLRLDITGDS